MMKKSVASLELAALVNELQFLVKGKLSQVYHQEKKELLFQLHAPGKGKQLLKVIPGKYLCLTKKKEAPLRPSSFCMQLRKYLDNAFIKDIYQKDAERIVVFELEKREKYFLIIELFSKGNLILTDDKHNIVAVLERQTWKERVIKPKERYLFPSSGVNWKKITEKELINIFKRSEKKNLAVSLATEVGLGGLYAEEICRKADIDKNKTPKEVNKKEVKLIIKAIKEFQESIKKPSGFVYEEQITPFPLVGEKEKKKTATYGEALDTLNPFQAISPYEKKIKTLQRMISQQEEAIKSQKRKINLNTKKGETVYEKYQPLQKLLDFVKKSREDNKEWKEIEKELKKIKKIKMVDLKNKKIIIDLS